MRNRSSEIPGEPGRYVVSLDVFHQLHCLNGLRKLVYPETYNSLESKNATRRQEQQRHIGKEVQLQPWYLLDPANLADLLHPRSLRRLYPAISHVQCRHHAYLLAVEHREGGYIAGCKGDPRLSRLRRHQIVGYGKAAEGTFRSRNPYAGLTRRRRTS